ncbi:MAG: hypothetical protein KF777_09715 [Planctomycetaceae bacterium]|nr:hypothetical protein [Planctomycetaceae bacterium]
MPGNPGLAVSSSSWSGSTNTDTGFEEAGVLRINKDLIIWTDLGNSIRSSSSGNGQGSTMHCRLESRGSVLEINGSWPAGGKLTLTLAGQTFSPENGNLIMVRHTQNGVECRQIYSGIPTGTIDRESLLAFARNDADLCDFFGVARKSDQQIDAADALAPANIP